MPATGEVFAQAPECTASNSMSPSIRLPGRRTTGGRTRTHGAQASCERPTYSERSPAELSSVPTAEQGKPLAVAELRSASYSVACFRLALSTSAAGRRPWCLDDIAPGSRGRSVLPDQLKGGARLHGRRSPSSNGSRWNSAATSPRSSSTTPTPRSWLQRSSRVLSISVGQVFTPVKRAYMPEALYDCIVEGLANHARSVTVGGGTEEDVRLGPISHQPQCERVKELVADALATVRLP